MERGSISDDDVAFAINQSNFTDVVLRIEIMGDSIHPQPDSEGCTTIADRARVRSREDVKKENSDEAVDSNDSNLGMDYSAAAVASVKTLHISSRILADKSPFFCKLFSNVIRESEQRCVTLRIDASEEVALVELLKFMYSNTLSVKTTTGLLEVLMAAKKYEVASCVIYCSRLLTIRPIAPNSALLYQDLPSSVLMADAAKQYLDGLYKDISKFPEEVMSFPLAGLEAILSSDDLQVVSEDAVYDFVLKWARKHYGNLEERQEVLGARLAQLIRFPYMTSRKLKMVLTCSDFDHDVASKLVLEALLFKVEAPHPEWSLTAEESASLNCSFKERAYKYHRVKVVKFKLPRQQCVVYMDLKREECAKLFPSGRVYSQPFHFGGLGFFLSGQCSRDRFGLFLGIQEKCPVSFIAELEFAARSRQTQEFVYKYKGNYTIKGGKAIGFPNFFAIPWTSFMAGDCAYFINGVLHLQAKLTIKD